MMEIREERGRTEEKTRERQREERGYNTSREGVGGSGRAAVPGESGSAEEPLAVGFGADGEVGDRGGEGGGEERFCERERERASRRGGHGSGGGEEYRQGVINEPSKLS